MSVEINFPMFVKLGYLAYASAVLALTDLSTAICLIPMIILSAHAVWARPKAVCVIGQDRELCLQVMAAAAEHLDVPEIHVYSADRKDELKDVGIYDPETGNLYEFEEEEDA